MRNQRTKERNQGEHARPKTKLQLFAKNRQHKNHNQRTGHSFEWRKPKQQQQNQKAQRAKKHDRFE